MSSSYAAFKRDILNQLDQKYVKYPPKYKRDLVRTILHLYTIQRSQKQSIKVGEQRPGKPLEVHSKPICYAEIKQQAIEREKYREKRQQAAILIQRWIRDMHHRRIEHLRDIFSMWASSFVVQLNFAAWKIQFAWLHWKETQDIVPHSTKSHNSRPIELQEEEIMSQSTSLDIDSTIPEQLHRLSIRPEEEIGLDASSVSFMISSRPVSPSSQFNPNSPHQILITLEAVRNLVIPDGADLMDLKACISLFDPVNRVEKASFDSSTVSFESQKLVEWEVPEILTFRIDTQEVDMATVLMEWVVQVALLQVNKPMRTIGKIQVPLALLHTPLATDYSLARWFPLEKNAPGLLVKGDLRLTVSYRCHSSPHSSPISKLTRNISLAPRNKKIRDVKAAPSNSPPSSNSSPKDQRIPCPWSNTESKDDSSSHPSCSRTPPPRPRLKTSVSMPADLSEFPIDNEEEHLNGESISQRQFTSKPFLKRKPYKVVFQKLDWSKITAKTNTNLNASPSSPSSGSTPHGSGHVVYLAPQIVTQGRKLHRTTSEGSNVSSGTASSGGVSLDFNKAQSIICYSELEKQVYEKCGVTSKQSASLLKLKYQKELSHFFSKSRSENSQIPVLNPKTSSLFKQMMSMEELEASQFYCQMLHKLQ